MSEKKNDIGPGAIAENDGGRVKLTLYSPNWYAMQRYVKCGKSLPSTDDSFRKYVHQDDSADVSKFRDIIDCYKSIRDAVSVWDDKVYPDIVSVAADIYHYANDAPIYYNPIVSIADNLQNEPNNESLKNKLKTILELLQQKAKAYEAKSIGITNDIKKFADNTSENITVLEGQNGDGGLIKKYKDEYGYDSKAVKDLTDKLDKQRKVLEAANQEYDHDVVVAATTPTYAWAFPPIGIISAAVVAGIYGKKATAALDTAREAEQQINRLSKELAFAARLVTIIGFANVSLINTRDTALAALPVIEKIRGAWNAIASDIGSIITSIDDKIEKVPPLIMDLGVDSAIQSWTAVGEQADIYRRNAFVTIKEEN